MINGEEIRENSSELPSPELCDEFPPWQGQKLDVCIVSPVSSQYSSCGESDFERYCSANSFLGTPSICSSSFSAFNECIDSEFGSVRSFGAGEDGNLENFSSGKGFDRDFESRKLSSPGGLDYLGHYKIESYKQKTDSGPKMKYGLKVSSNEGSSSFHEARNDMISSKFESESQLLRATDLNTEFDRSVRGDGRDNSGVAASFAQKMSARDTSNAEGHLFYDQDGNGSHLQPWGKDDYSSHVIDEVGEGCFQGINSQYDLQFDEIEAGKLSEGETSSRYEHSEGEDSMFDYGTENEHNIDLQIRPKIQNHQKEKTVNGNLLLMNSSIAFGSEDWDDFMQETGETTLASSMFDKFEEQKQVNLESERVLAKSSYATPDEVQDIVVLERGEDVGSIHETSEQIQGANESREYAESCSVAPISCFNFDEQEQGCMRDIIFSNQVQGANELAEAQSCSASKIFQTEQNPQTLKDPLRVDVSTIDSGRVGEHQYITTEKVIGLDGNRVSESQELEKAKLKLDPLSDIKLCSTEASDITKPKFFENQIPTLLPSVSGNGISKVLNDFSVSAYPFEDHPAPIEMGDLDLNDSYDEVVNEMEEILLDSAESPGARFSLGNKMSESQLHLPLRDGGSTASTSGSDDARSLTHHPLRIEGIEVVGAKQKNGDVSFSERLVGVKEYTVYIIRVWNNKDQWEVERRYRDFYTLYRRMKTLFANQDWILPSPWSSVERESRKIFGNASPDVVSERSALIQECLRSILHSRFSSSPPSALIWFLSPQNGIPSSPAPDTLLPRSTSVTRGAETENISTLGKTISLVVEIRPYKSMKELLEAQHYTCAGCHSHFDGEKTLMRDFVQTFGWGKPRLCEYTGQLFCSSCHTNDTLVLPARVLHLWDFTQHPVSQLAKSYLDSIHDQPMLCVSAVNPFLFSKVPTLLNVMNIRKKIGAMLPYVRCPFRKSINKGLASRRYLLEGNDFFALRDLIDLSKGVFAVLPVMLETVSRKILEHIAEQCLVCCDVGVPCGARQACNDPSSFIFPFQEGEVEKCKSCQSVFHKPCFRKLTYCPCGGRLRADEAMEPGKRIGAEEDGALDLLGRKLSSVGFLSGLFSKGRQEDGDNVILMGSLPSTSI